MKRLSTALSTFLIASSFLFACGSDDADNEQPKACIAGQSEGCEDGQVCEEVVGGTTGCFAPISVQGRVFDVETDEGVEGATVVARDANDFPVSSVALTSADGTYELAVPATRNEDGTIAETSYTLRADATGYLTFPLAPRTALPIDISAASDGVVKSPATDVGLVSLGDVMGLGTITGKIDAEDPAGTLVVAGGVTAIADKDGNFTLFNVAEGAVEVKAYKAGINLGTANVDVDAGKTTEGVSIGVVSDQAATVSGKVEIVNPGDGNDTSVILVLEDTFNENAARGESPPGLRAANVSGTFEIEGVPDGKYVVLAAFENDFLVRDPDTSIGGTDIVHITVSGSDVVLDESFKITGALDVVAPDGEEVVSATPTFEFADDSGEEEYSLVVFDALGNLVWEQTGIPKVTGSATVSVPYEGPALVSGEIYQFRATSFKSGGAPISRTEDLRGVFRVE